MMSSSILESRPPAESQVCPAIQESEGGENTLMNNKVTLATQWAWKVGH